LTSSDQPQDRARANELGASGFVTKPYDLSDYVRFFDSLLPA
jgi:CheY-like chemotaxis protein